MTTLTFQNTSLSVINHKDQTWFTGLEIGRALGYKDPSSNIAKLFERNRDEFSENMTALIDMSTISGMQKVRIFSLRGCHLIGMLSHTKVAKDFRKWVLDILDNEIENAPRQMALPEPEPRYSTTFSAQEISRLVWLLFSHEQMRGLLEQLYPALEAIGSRYAAAVYGNYTEYKRHYRECLPIIKSLVAYLKADRPHEWEALNARLRNF